MDARAVLAVTYPHINLIRRMETRHQESVIKKASSRKHHEESIIMNTAQKHRIPKSRDGSAHERIDVDTRAGMPHRIHYRRSTDTVRNIDDTWVYRSRWWAREEERRYFKLRCERWVLIVFVSDNAWYVDRRWD